ncbi:MAG: PEP/pyruvate-binding domain-containing protein [Kofleriaceae bacterium]
MTARRAVLAAAAALAIATLGAGCDDAAVCELAPGARADAIERVGCPADFDALATSKDDSVFAHTQTILVIVDREDGDRLHFIDSQRYALHYEYALGHLALAGKTPVGTLAEFNILNYRRPNRRFILGKLVRYVDQDVLTYELAAGDTADAGLIVGAFDRVRGAIFDGDRLRYRAVSAEQERLLPEIAAQIPTIGTDQVFRGQTYQPLNPGVAYGVLRFRKTATLDGTPLAPTDLVVLDRVPNDVAMVAGIVTAEFQTPLAHVSVLAKTRGTPNMALRGAWDDPRLRGFADQLVRLEVGPQDFTIAVGDPAEAQAYWTSLRPATLQVPQHDSLTLPLFDVTRSTVDNVVQIGAKAANLGDMYTVGVAAGRPLPLPERPLAIPFAHYARHLAAAGVDGDLAQLAADYGAGLVTPAQLEARLFSIRWRIYRQPIDPALLTQLTTLMAARWPDTTKLRFRSSTNVEDLAEFTGAGLYTSAGARRSDGDDAIANAIKTVWASAWNPQAFVERDFYRVQQSEVRMGVLVHPAQEDELANGVALTINEFSERRPAFYINSQLGDVSVTNPTGAATPEQILYYTWYEEPEYEVITRSSLMPWAQAWPSTTAILTDPELDLLAGYLTDINARIRARYPGSAADVEWKLLPGRLLIIKQARPFRSRTPGT